MLVTPLRGKAALAAHHTTADLNIYEGSVRSGKTITSLIAWLRFVLLAPPGELLLCGRTERTVKRNIVDVLAEMLGPSRCRFNAGQGELHLLGRRVYVVGANDTRSEEKIRGLTLVGAYVDEASKVPESFWQMLRSRLSVDGAMLIASTNPDSPNHWLKENWLDRASLHLTGNGDIEANTEDPINLHRFSFRLADNPNLSSRFVENITRDYTGLWYRRFILGEWVAAVGAVYEMLDPAVHHRPAPGLDSVDRLWLGIDYGTSNPTHAVLLALTGEATDHPRLHVTAEWRHDGRSGTTLTDPGLSKRLADWLLSHGLRPEDVDPVLDPSAASFRAQLKADGWSRLKPADNRVLTGIRSTGALLDPRPGKGPMLVLDTAAAPALWKELTGYVWDPTAQAAGRDEPRKVDDHGADALRYAVMAARPYWRRWVTVLDTLDVDLDQHGDGYP